MNLTNLTRENKVFHTDIKIELQKLQNVSSTELNLNINLSVFLFKTQLSVAA